MAHVRTQIRAALIAALKAAGTAAGNNVFDSRVLPLQASELPALSVSTGDETSAPITGGAPANTMDRAVAITVTAHLYSTDDTHATALDDLLAQVEVCIAQNVHAGGAQNIYPTESGADFDGDSDGVRAEGRVVFQCLYQTSQINPTILR